MSNPHVGDIGTAIEVTVTEGGVALNVSAATTKQIKLRKPISKAVLTKTAVFTTDGSDGKIEYVTVSGDLDEAGDWEVQAYVVLPNWTGHTEPGTFEVESNL